MFRRLGFALAALALFTMAGGHWAALQTVAWAGMLRTYSERTGSLSVAISQTFDGEHPCELCREIASARSKEQKQAPAALSLKENAPSPAVAAAPVLRAPVCTALGFFLPRTISSLVHTRTDAPPTPPPRWADRAA